MEMEGMEILSLGGWLEVWPRSLSSSITNLDLGDLLYFFGLPLPHL